MARSVFTTQVTPFGCKTALKEFIHAGLGATADENLTAEVAENAEYLLSLRSLRSQRWFRGRDVLCGVLAYRHVTQKIVE